MPPVPLPFSCAAIIVAAGSSRRMGFDKLAAELDGMPVLKRTILALASADSISSIVVVCPLERWKNLGPLEISKPLRRVDGGKERQDSVAAGLAALDADVSCIAVHDGARPLVSAADIDRCIASAQVHRASSLARRVTETVKRSTPDDFCADAVSRENLWFMETPQVFELSLLRRAYETLTIAVTDEVSAVEMLGVPVKFVESTAPNLKITTPGDLALASALLKSR
ncbi:MAG: 2-C-methyl-D-erythritol 4-phosphate cytidylyltransferase [Luteolibacter sp.]